MKQKKQQRLTLNKLTVANLGQEAAQVIGGTGLFCVYSVRNTCRCVVISLTNLTVSLQCPVTSGGTSIVINPLGAGF